MQANTFLLTGLSGAGKTTLAKALYTKLKTENYPSIILDGDEVRKGLCSDLGYSLEDRTESLRRVANMISLLSNDGLICICAFIAPLHSQRMFFSKILGTSYHEIYIECPLNICQQRDVKGLYAKVRKGDIQEYTGISSPYEVPTNPHLIIPTYKLSIEESIHMLYEYIVLNINNIKD